MNKRGIEISVNFLVMLIIALVVFGFSIGMVRKFFGSASDVKLQYDQRAEAEIERLLDDGSRVVVPFDRKEISNGDTATFSVGLRNVLDSAGATQFTANIKANQCIGKNGGSCSIPETMNLWLQTTSGLGDQTNGASWSGNILNNDKQKFLIGVTPEGAQPGTYIYDIEICTNLDVNFGNCAAGDFKYDRTHKLYVIVP